MKRLAFALFTACVVFAAFAAAPPAARAATQCGLPSAQPLWIDFAPSSDWPALAGVFRRSGVILAGSQPREGPDYLGWLRAGGAKTIYWDMYLNTRVGTTSEPADPALVVERANRLFEHAAQTTGCATPLIAENELFGASTTTPWSPTNAQYRANVLLFLRTLAARGARPFLLVSSDPYTGGAAREWWLEVAKVADLVREDYFHGALLARQGAIGASRTLRTTFRRSILAFTRIGIPTRRLGVMLGFQTTPGLGGREKLPSTQWFELVKLQALAAREVARELKLASLWSWGWGTWSPEEDDPDKPAAACVWLWARNPVLCNGPAAAGPSFNNSRKEGQLALPRGAFCVVDGERISWSDVRTLARITGDEELAVTALVSRRILQAHVQLSAERVAATERALIALRFGGTRAAYIRAISRARARQPVARAIVADELRRSLIASRLTVRAASETEIREYYSTYGQTTARLVETKPAAPWLGGRRRGVALEGLAPQQIFGLTPGATTVVRTPRGVYRVRALSMTLPLAALPLQTARPAIAVRLETFARAEAFAAWLAVEQRRALQRAVCYRDRLPAVGDVDLTTYLPFLAL